MDGNRILRNYYSLFEAFILKRIKNNKDKKITFLIGLTKKHFQKNFHLGN